MLFELSALIGLAISGVFIGFMGSLIGVGGGFLMVPLLVLLFNIPAQHAVGTSTAVIVFNAISATYAYSRQKRVDWKLGLLTAALSVPGAVLGAYATKLFSSQALGVIFGVALGVVSARILLRSVTSAKKSVKDSPTLTRGGRLWVRRIVDSHGHVFEYSFNPLRGVVLLFFAGFVAGFLGVGGGIVVVPVFDIILSVPIHLAVATSMFAMIFTSLSGFATHLQLGNVIPTYAAPLALGVVSGAQIGARVARSLRGPTLERVFGIALFLVGIYMIITRLLST